MCVRWGVGAAKGSKVLFAIHRPIGPGFRELLEDLVVGSLCRRGWTSTFSFDMSSLGKALIRHTTVGTNLPLRHLDGLKGRLQPDPYPPERAPPSVWTREFSEVVAIAVRAQRLAPRMLRVSADQWREHVRRGHLPYRSDCMTCVSAGATGRRHARVEHPSCFVMSADVSGPLKIPGLDADGRGAFPKPHKYLFVAKVKVLCG